MGEVVISGGTFVQSANGTIIGECGIGSLTVEKGGVYSSMQPLRVGESGAYHPDAECVVRLAAGGTLMASLIHDGHTPAQEVHTGVVEFDGGTLVVAGISADVPDFIHDLKALRVKEGGVLFDTRANTAGVAMDFTGDSENGGFVKLGSGRLTLSGANTWTGRTIVSNGTLVVASPASLPGWDEPSRVFLCRNTAVEFGAGWTAEQIAAAQANFAHEQVADAEYDTQGGEITVTESLALEGGISKLGAGTLTLLGENAYADALTVWGGLLRADWGVGLDALRPLVLRGGTYAPVNGNAVTDRLGDGAGEISLYEGTASGFSAKGTPLHVSLQTGAPANALVWGASDFSPTALVLNGAEADADITLENPIDLNGHADAMVSVAAQTATLAGGVTDSSGLGVGALTKSGAGTLVFGAGAENDFPQYVHDGGTTVFPAGAKSRFDQLTGKWGPVRVEGGELDVEAFLFFYANGRYVQSGGAVTCPSVMLGGWESTGSAEIRGGSFVQSAAGDALVVGENGHGAFDVYAGGTATVAGTLEIGRVSTGSGLVNVHEGGVLGAARIRGKNGLWKEFALQPGATLVAEGEGRDDAFVDGLDSFHAARGATLDTNGRDVTVKLPTAKALVIPRAVLTHRWSFNGGLEDSVGERTATMDGGAAFLENGRAVRLPGGEHGAGAIDLGSNLLPSEGDVTIEIWATQQGAHHWSRVLEIGSSITDAMLMAWTAGTDVNADDFCIKTSNGGHDYWSLLAPYTLGTEFHLALTFARRDDGLWDVKVYKQDATTGETLKSLAFTTSEGWSPATQNQSNFYLGRSHSAMDHDANADYNEVRIWNTALTEAQLTALAVAGPDALPTDLNHGVAAGCESATVALVEGTTLNVVNATTVKTLSGAGTVKGGALTAEIHPEGTLTVAAGATLAGTVYLDAAASGVCDRLVYAGACDVTGLSLALEPEAVLSGSAPYEVMTFPPNAFTGPFASATLPKGWNLHVNEAAGVVRLARDGFVIILR